MKFLNYDRPNLAQPRPYLYREVGPGKRPINKGNVISGPTGPTCTRAYACISFFSSYTKVQKKVGPVRPVGPNKHWSGFRVAQPRPNRPYLKAGVSHA